MVHDIVDFDPSKIKIRFEKYWFSYFIPPKIPDIDICKI